MSQINELTEEQKSKFPYYVDKWTKIGLCTDSANREKAEECINKIYTAAGLEIPSKIIWCGSPFSLGLTKILYEKESLLNIVKNAVKDFKFDFKEIITKDVYDKIKTSVDKKTWDEIITDIKESMGNCGYGSHDAAWLAFYDFFRTEVGLVEQTEKLVGLAELASYAGWFLPYDTVCFISERHSILNRDDRGRIHSLTSPAISYPDGWSIYSIHGVRVSEFIIMDPDKITVEMIENQRNSEVRRVMVNQYDRNFKGKYIQDSGAQIINEDVDQYGRPRILYKKELQGDEPLVMVKVTNSTAEPDGTFKEYYLRVPPDIKTAHEAISWSFDEDPDEYKPLIET